MNIQALGLVLRRVMDGHVLAAGVVLPWWLSVVSGMMPAVTDVPPEGRRDPRDALIREQGAARGLGIAAGGADRRAGGGGR